MQTKPWHTTTINEAFKQLKSQPGGLATTEVETRLQQYGPNELQAAHRVSPWEILLEQFKNVLILILLAATAISLVLGQGVESIVIGVIVLFTLGLILVGIPIAIGIWIVTGIWVIYRLLRGYMLFKDSKAVPGA